MEKDYTKYIKPYLEELDELEAIATDAQPQLGKFKAKSIIFDIYGTLLISASGDVDKADYNGSMISRALKAAHFDILKNCTEAFDHIFEVFNNCLAQHLQKGKAEGRPYPEVNIIEVWDDTLTIAEEEGSIKRNEKSDLYLFTFVFELQTNKVWPMPQLIELISALQQLNIPLGIVSNAQFYTPVIMNYFLNGECKTGRSIAPFADDISVFSYEELRGKPDTTLFQKLLPGMVELNIKPEETLFVGNDMLKDVYTANQVGFKTVLFGGDERSYRLRQDDERCMNLKPDYVITELTQLLDIIE